MTAPVRATPGANWWARCRALRWCSWPAGVISATQARRGLCWFGFATVGPAYLEDGIPHVEMLRRARTARATGNAGDLANDRIAAQDLGSAQGEWAHTLMPPCRGFPMHYSQGIRRHRRRRVATLGTGGWRWRRCGWLRHAAADPQRRNHRSDELQPVDRRHRTTSSKGGRRAQRKRWPPRRTRRGSSFASSPVHAAPPGQATRAQADRSSTKRRSGAAERQLNLWLLPPGGGRPDRRGWPRDRRGDLRSGSRFTARAVVPTAGTFLDGRIHVGLTHHAGGRAAIRPPSRCRRG